MEKIIASIRIRPIKQLKTDPTSITIRRAGPRSVIALKHSDKFSFERVYGPEASNGEVFQVSVKPLIERALKGYNVCLFTYGQTASGKTFTMKGSKESPGIIPQSLEFIFKRYNELKRKEGVKGGLKVEVLLSYVEIYNENINDLLLHGNSGLRLRVKSDKTLWIENLSKVKVESFEDAIKQ